MKCPMCDSEIGNCNVCPFCEYDLNDTVLYDKQTEKSKNKSKSSYLDVFQITYIILAVLGIIILFVTGNSAEAIAGVVVSIIFIFFINIAKTIIDLLQSIDEKLDK